MVGSDIVAIVLITAFGAGFVYMSFILPAKQKKNGTWNEGITSSEPNKELIMDDKAKAENSGKKQGNMIKGKQKNMKIMK